MGRSDLRGSVARGGRAGVSEEAVSETGGAAGRSTVAARLPLHFVRHTTAPDYAELW